MDMTTSDDLRHLEEDVHLAELARIENLTERPEMSGGRPAGTGIMGRMFGRRSGPSSYERRLELDSANDVASRVARIVAYRLVHGHRRDTVRMLPEVLFDSVLPEDDEDRFLVLADAVRTMVAQHLEESIGDGSDDRTGDPRIAAIVDALGEESVAPLSQRLRLHLNARLVERGRDAELVREDAILIEVDNVMLADVSDDGSMAYAMDVLVDGHPIATVASMGDGSLSVLALLGGHGPDDLESLRSCVAYCGEPRSDGPGPRPDSLEEVLLDRVTALLIRHAFVAEMAESVLFCDEQDDAPGGHVIRVAVIDPEAGREATWDAVMEEFPRAVLLDALGEDDAFTLWMAHSDR